MPKTVINLMKDLGAKNTHEVLELLVQVGFDTKVEGFGVMSKVDDETIAKVMTLKGKPASGEAEPKAARKTAGASAAKAEAAPGETAAKEAPRGRAKAIQEPEKLPLGSQAKKPAAAGKDFFGARKAAASATAAPAEKEAPAKRTVTTAGSSATAQKREPAPAGAAQAQGSAQRQPARPAATPPAAPRKPDLSSGPRIISMPDPQERARLQAQQRARVTGSGPAPAGGAGGPGPVGADKKKAPARAGEKAKRRDEESAAGRRKIKEIGGTSDDGTMRSRKRVFKVSGPRAEAGPAVVPHIKIPGSMPLRELAAASGRKVAEIVRFLLRDLGTMATINYVASVDEIQLIAEHFGIKYTVSLEQEPEGELQQFEQIDEEKLVLRPPVVTIMGHVDHGKTKLLDTIRTTNVMGGEAGGITQHIGAYQVEKKGKHITFIDTPGHEAFTAMRARGSHVTDIVILVVAADDGVMPTTIEAINHAKAANVPIIVAINKMDRPDANPDRVKTQLSEHGLTPEEWGGDTVTVPVSALKGEGIDDLLEHILLAAELQEPKADPTAPSYGVVIESKVDTGIGVVATVLVRQGTLVKGQFILSGTSVGRIKRMENDRGEEIHDAGPSTPARIIGFAEPPENGDKIYAFQNKKQAQAIADQRVNEMRLRASAKASGRVSLEKFFAKATEGEIKDLNLIVKADVGGSAEALSEALKKLEVEGTKCHVISSGVGQINDTDINLAAASQAVVIGFHVGISSTARRIAEREHIEIRLYDIIYKVTEDIEKAMKGLLAPEFEEKILGHLEVRAIFKVEKGTTICGGYVLDGVARRNAKFRYLRGKEVLIKEATLSSLRRFKDDAREVATGFECGMSLDLGSAVTVQEGDVLEIFEMVEKPRD